MPRWSIRDLRGHYAHRADSGRPCPHACCRGTRPHPAGLPVMRRAAASSSTAPRSTSSRSTRATSTPRPKSSAVPTTTRNGVRLNAAAAAAETQYVELTKTHRPKVDRAGGVTLASHGGAGRVERRTDGWYAVRAGGSIGPWSTRDAAVGWLIRQRVGHPRGRN